MTLLSVDFFFSRKINLKKFNLRSDNHNTKLIRIKLIMGNFVSSTGCEFFLNNSMSLDINVTAVLQIISNTIHYTINRKSCLVFYH